ncbi:unnamed protein product, partial [Allacma fusca]
AATVKPTSPEPQGKVLENGNKTKTPPNCRKMMLLMAKKQMKVIKFCFDQVKAQYPDKDEMNKHFQCVIKCALEKEQLLDSNSKITNETVQPYFEKNIPVEYHKIGYGIVLGCSEKWNSKFDPAEPTCMAYGEYAKCMQEYVSDVC